MPEERYWVVEEDDLNKWGPDRRGWSLEELNSGLDLSQLPPLGDLVIIRGEPMIIKGLELQSAEES